jgi:hypothetical protein
MQDPSPRTVVIFGHSVPLRLLNLGCFLFTAVFIFQLCYIIGHITMTEAAAATTEHCMYHAWLKNLGTVEFFFFHWGSFLAAVLLLMGLTRATESVWGHVRDEPTPPLIRDESEALESDYRRQCEHWEKEVHYRRQC